MPLSRPGTARPRRPRSRWPRVAAIALVAALGLDACVGTVKTPRRDEIEPLPPSIHVVAEAVEGCKGDGSGFRYLFLVLDTRDLSPGGPLGRHLDSRDYTRSMLYVDDLPWVTVAFDHRTVPVRVALGPLERYLRSPLPHQGPRPDELPAEVRAEPDRYTLVAMRPTDFTCDNLE